MGDGLAPEVKSHKLVDLLHRTGLTLSNEESYLARRLQAFVEWSGRYPIPAKLEDQLPGRNRSAAGASESLHRD